jgi:hypothetical protein
LALTGEAKAAYRALDRRHPDSSDGEIDEFFRKEMPEMWERHQRALAMMAEPYEPEKLAKPYRFAVVSAFMPVNEFDPQGQHFFDGGG